MGQGRKTSDKRGKSVSIYWGRQQQGVPPIARKTLTGHPPGRFSRSEVFELPFMMTNPAASALAFRQMVDEDLPHTAFSDVKFFGAWVHGP